MGSPIFINILLEATDRISSLATINPDKSTLHIEALQHSAYANIEGASIESRTHQYHRANSVQTLWHMYHQTAFQ
jgi:hypothetical protein